jgi:hypothetical protein
VVPRQLQAQEQLLLVLVPVPAQALVEPAVVVAAAVPVLEQELALVRALALSSAVRQTVDKCLFQLGMKPDLGPFAGGSLAGEFVVVVRHSSPVAARTAEPAFRPASTEWLPAPLRLVPVQQWCRCLRPMQQKLPKLLVRDPVAQKQTSPNRRPVLHCRIFEMFLYLPLP